MLIKPIPRKVLVHSVVHQKNLGTDRFNKPSFDSGTILKFVRVESFRKFTVDSSGEKVSKDMFRMFYDLKNSTPQGVTFAEDDQIIFKSKILKVKKVIDSEALDGDNPHHYEIECE